MNSIQNIKLVLALFVIFLYTQNTFAQNPTFWSNVRYGGNIGIGFSGDTFSGVIAPSAIYDFNNQFGLGVGFNFGYTDGLNFTASNYGGSVFSIYSPFNELELSTEFELMGVSRRFDELGSQFKDDYWYPALYLGAAYRMRFISIGLRYDVLYDDDKSIYASPFAPFVRIFF
ncbi:alpha-ketoglutarate decarboxylase [Aquimarina addita]